MQTLRFALLLALLAPSAGAQVLDARQPRLLDQWIFGISVYPAFPVGEFAKHQRLAGGLDLSLGFQPWRRQPLTIRSNFGWLQYDSQNENETGEVCDFFGNNCQTETFFYDSQNHSMSFVQIGPEFFATDGTWRPYAYALTGATFFHSTARFGSAASSSSGSNGLHFSWNPSSAYGIGIRHVGAKDGRQWGWDFGARVLRNAEAEYVTKDGVYRNPDGTYDVHARHGAANLLIIHIGFNGGPFVNWSERPRR
jgi:hypothetical protein